MKSPKNEINYPDWEHEVLALDTPEEVFKAYEQEWKNRKTPPLNWPILSRIIHGFKPTKESWFKNADAEPVADLIRRSPIAAQEIMRFKSSLHDTLTCDDDCSERSLIALMALSDVDSFTERLSDLLAQCPTAVKARLLARWVRELTRVWGRARTKREISCVWGRKTLLEEEKESVIEAALEEHAYDWQTLPSLSPQARTIALALLAREQIRPSDLGPFITGEPLKIAPLRGLPDPVVQKVTALAQQAVVPTRLVGAGLKPEELDRVGLAWLHPILTALAFSRHRRLFHHPMIEEFFDMWRHEWPSGLQLNLHGAAATNGFRMLGVPLIRLLHMRLVLEAPFLSSALASPENSLAPEVMLYLLGQEGVAYSPEIALPAGSSPGWRRRWAETTGEALSSLFMEDALRLDLTTLFRLPESRDEKTPDFGAKTFAGEQIVFESKGATSWDSFCKSKRKALRQLAKDSPTTSWQQSLGWRQGARGRAFACCLFCTNGAETESSQFHVEDPPFAFAGLFHEGWESAARRRHYGAVLQAAGLFAQAAAVLEGEDFEVADNTTQEHSLELPDGELAKFVGKARDLSGLASSLGHPQPGPFEKVKVFTGIEKELLSALSHQELPAGSPFGIEANEDFSTSKIPPLGLLPGENPDAAPRGVFSRLSNGSYLAVSVGKE